MSTVILQPGDVTLAQWLAIYDGADAALESPLLLSGLAFAGANRRSAAGASAARSVAARFAGFTLSTHRSPSLCRASSRGVQQSKAGWSTGSRIGAQEMSTFSTLSTAAMGAMGRRSQARTRPEGPTRWATTWLQLPGAAPRSTTRAPRRRM